MIKLKGLVHPKMKIKSLITPLINGPSRASPLGSLWRTDPALRFNQKYLYLCSEDERRSYGVGTAWGWV